jgi:hypothetical protein
MQQMGVPEKNRPLAQKYIEKLTAVMQEELSWEKPEQPLVAWNQRQLPGAGEVSTIPLSLFV